MIGRGVALVACAWLAVVGVARFVGLPEQCPPVDAADSRAAAEEAVGWFARNQQPDGRWVYRYDRRADTVDRRQHVVRQAGITLALYQAHAAGIEGALGPADDGVDWLLEQVVRHDTWAAIGGGGTAPTGASALAAAALATRNEATADGRYETDMRRLGRFLVAMTEPSGAVAAHWDIEARRPVPDDHSPFFTGEAYLALAHLATLDPEGEWGLTADRIGAYLATDRDDAEDRFPPTSDHWAAYGLAQMAVDAGRPLDDDERHFADRLAGIFGVQVRYESQRTDRGLNRAVLRGPQVLGAGLGTLGEGLGSLWRLAEDGEPLEHQDVIGERARCVAGMLVERQVGEDEAAESGHPGLARGAWFHEDVTQMDDQQHALSALLLAEPLLAGPARAAELTPSPDDVSLGRALWLGVVALAVVNPWRARRQAGGLPGRAVAVGAAVAGAVVALAALAGPAVLRAGDVSASTGLIAAGLVVALAAVVDAVRRPAVVPPAGPGGGALVPLAVPALVRPAVALLAVATTAAGGFAAGAVVAGAVAIAGASTRMRAPLWAGGGRERMPAELVRWAFVALAVAGGVDLVAHGVLSV